MGSTVAVVGTSRSDLNGQEGSVTAYREQSGRYCVKLLSGDVPQEVSLKPDKLCLPFAAALQPAAEVRRRLEQTLSDARALADPRREQALELKRKANESLSAGQALANGDAAKVPALLAAARSYTEAIELCPQDAILFSNRSACHMLLGQCDGVADGSSASSSSSQYDIGSGSTFLKKAVQDAKRCVKLRPTWPKAYHRLGTAHFLVANAEGCHSVYHRCAGQAFLDGCRYCYPLGRGGTSPKSTEGQAPETHAPGDAMFKALTAGWQQISPLFRPTTTTAEQKKRSARGCGGRDCTY